LNLDAIVNNNKSEADKLQINFLANDISTMADEVRTFSHEISPLLLKKNGLILTIQQLIDSINKTGKLTIQFENIGSVNHVSFPTEIMLYNILHELIQNIIKHSEADFSIMQLMIENEIISIFVEDNGKGFDPNETTDGLGFIQIKKLIAFVDGNFSIDTSLNKGCKISIEFKNIDHE
jgi:signal transduction histidine kinase